MDFNKIYVCRYFKIQELVPKSIYEARHDEAWQLFDPRILYSLDCIRELLDSPLIVNTWHNGGKFQYRGFRPQGCGEGTPLSQHRFGRAVDFVSEIKADMVRHKIAELSRLFPFITYMEDGTEWIHIDCRASKNEEITLFKP